MTQQQPPAFGHGMVSAPVRQVLREAAAALDAAEQRGRPCEMSQALQALARGHLALQATAAAETYLEQALRWARPAGSHDAVVDLLCELSETAQRLAAELDEAQPGHGHAARERARDHAFEAATLAGHVADRNWEVKVLLRVSDVLDCCGDRDDAVQLQVRALRLMAGPGPETRPDPRLLPSLGRLADA